MDDIIDDVVEDNAVDNVVDNAVTNAVDNDAVDNNDGDNGKGGSRRIGYQLDACTEPMIIASIEDTILLQYSKVIHLEYQQ